MKDMGKVVGVLKSKVAGRADMGEVSKLVKQNSHKSLIKIEIISVIIM